MMQFRHTTFNICDTTATSDRMALSILYIGTSSEVIWLNFNGVSYIVE